MTITVGKEGQYQTIGEAIEAAERQGGDVIHIFPGRYYEKLTIRQPNLVLEGEDEENTIITYDDYANAILPNGEKRGTFRSYTMLADAPGIQLRHLTIENAAGFREGSGQSIALYAEGEGIVVRNCRLLSSQDTLFTGPLPPSVIVPGGFKGPKEFAPRVNGRQFYFDCYICGGVDFIFGSATAYFENCTLYSIRSGYVTAGSSPEGQKYGYVFQNCRFEGNAPDKSVFLGRPWRDYARVVILNSYLGPHIKPEGWHDWQREWVHDLVVYAEYQNYGPGAEGERVSWSRQLTPAESEEYTLEKIIHG